MTAPLDGLHAIVGGASQGIGRATAELLAERGAEITLLARSVEALEDVRAGLATEHGQNHVSLPVDFTDLKRLREAVEARVAERPAQILVHNTGGPPAGSAHEAGVDAFRRAFEQHLLAGQVLLQAVLPGMREAGYGRLINVISTSVKQPIPNLGVSNTVRGAVANWAKTLSRELARDGITVNNVLPGFTDTPRLAALIRGTAEKSGRSEQEVGTEMRASVPAGRFAEPRETAAAIAFLASREAGYINGINLPVDGGRTASL